MFLGRQSRDELVVGVDDTHLRRATGRTEVVEEVHVGVVETLPLLGGVILVIDGLHRADRFTSTAIDALIGMDVEHSFAFIDAVDRTLVDTRAVLEVDTRLGDDVGHPILLKLNIYGRQSGAAILCCLGCPQPSIPHVSDPTRPIPESTPGSHLLGPHVIGQRVVIRRLLPGETGPTGGPAMTDVLGICVAWADGQATVRREDGSLVEMATADIISGKPVPPRPSLRHRVSPAEAQRRAFALFPDLQTVGLGEWILRSSDAHPARRGNSVLAMGSAPGDPLDDVLAWYVGRGKRPIAAVLPDSSEEAMFLAAGWIRESNEADTEFLIGSVAHAQRTRVPTEDVTLEECDGLAVARIGSIAAGIASYADDWIGFRNIEVHPNHRHQGLGLAIMAELIEWGAEQGARTAYLQVLGDNGAAMALYGKLGFSIHHTYRYLATPS